MPEASRACGISPSAIEGWVDEGTRGIENALCAKPEDVHERYERQLQQAYGEAMLELHVRKKQQPCAPAVPLNTGCIMMVSQWIQICCPVSQPPLRGKDCDAALRTGI